MRSRSDRYREVVRTLSVHGFGFVIGATGMSEHPPFRAGLPGHERGRSYRQPEHLRLALEQLGPTFVKLGQILSTRADLLPPDYVAELSRLQDAVPPVPSDAVAAIVAEELGTVGVFDAFDPQPLASASIGQVHAACVTGTPVVVKVRRPGAVETVLTDLEIVESLAERAERRSQWARDNGLVAITREFATTFRKELDYLQEARNAERFAAAFAGDSEVRIPAVFREHTTSRVLTLGRVEGIKIDDLDALDAAGVDRRALAERATRVLCRMVFQDGFFHADPHPGNFFVQPDGSLGVIDFGMVGELSHEVRARLVAFLIHLLRRDAGRTADALVDLTGSSGSMDRAALRDDLAPLIDRFGGLSLAELAAADLVSDVMSIARRHHLHMPNDLALLFKMLVMAEGLGQRLDPDFQLAAVVAPFAERLAAERLSPAALAEKVVEFVRDMLEAGGEAPRALRGLLAALERGGLDVHLREAELQPLVAQMERTGNRVVAGVIAAALINGVGHIAAGPQGRRSALRGPLVVAGAGVVVALGAHLGRGRARRRRSR